MLYVPFLHISALEKELLMPILIFNMAVERARTLE